MLCILIFDCKRYVHLLLCITSVQHNEQAVDATTARYYTTVIFDNMLLPS